MTFQQFLLSVLNAVLVAAIPVITGAFVRYFALKTKNEKLDTYLCIAVDTVKTAVSMVSQTVVDALKSDGAFTREEQIKALAMAKEIAKRVMGEAALQALSQATENVDAWLFAKIEAAIKDSKAQQIRETGALT